MYFQVLTKSSKVTEEHVLQKSSLPEMLQTCCEGGSKLLNNAEIQKKLAKATESIDARDGVSLVTQILQYMKLAIVLIKQVILLYDFYSYFNSRQLLRDRQ